MCVCVCRKICFNLGDRYHWILITYLRKIQIDLESIKRAITLPVMHEFTT